jgi:electron transport complex protein RnfD
VKRPSDLSAPHQHAGSSVDGMMWRVTLALLPVYILYLWSFGWGVLLTAAIVLAFCWICEQSAFKLRGMAAQHDPSIIVLALLLALSLPPYLPWWQSGLAAAFAVLIAKHAYGGLGRNLFNPAMAGCAFLLLCFPTLSSAWPPVSTKTAGFAEAVNMIFTAAPHADALSGATPLELVRTQLRLDYMMSELNSAAFGTIGAARWELLNVAALAGGILLLTWRTIAWHIPVAFLAGLTVASLLAYGFDTDLFPSPLFHLFSGATMLAAFFIATDPVSSPVTPRAKLAYGFGTGVLVFAIRTWGGYPDGVAFAVLIMNATAPIFDHWLRPRVVGT